MNQSLLALTITLPDWIFNGAFWGGFLCGFIGCVVLVFVILAIGLKDFRMF